MKKVVSLFVLATMTTGIANAAPSYIQPDRKGGYNITYDYTDKAKTGWYVAGRAELSFLSFENKYGVVLADTNVDKSADNDKYSFEPVFGGSLAAGKKINYFWRAELEAGYLGRFEDEDNTAKYSISLPYIMANGYYDFTNGLYVGAGVGASLAQYKISSAVYFKDFDAKKTKFSPMVGLMLGYTHKLDENLVVDLRYRLAGMAGAELSADMVRNDGSPERFKSKVDFILDNSISVGLRYEF